MTTTERLQLLTATVTQTEHRPLDNSRPRMVNHKQDIEIHQPALLLIMDFEDRHRSSRVDEERDTRAQYDSYRRGRSSPPQGRTGGYRDRDHEGYRSPRYDSRSRSRSPRRDRSPYYGGPPSREVILEALPLEMTEEDVPTPTTPSATIHKKLSSPQPK